MARPERHDADYFPFYAKRGRTLNILQAKFGLEGIGFFTNLLRFLTLTPDHHYQIKTPLDQMNLFTEIGINDEKRGLEILDLLSMTGKIDAFLWHDFQVIVSEDFLLSLQDAYAKRNNKIITLEEIRVSVSGNTHTAGFPAPETTPDTPKSDDKGGDNPQRKGKETKGKDSIVRVPGFSPNDGTKRIGKAQAAWNYSNIKPSSRIPPMQFKGEDLSGCLATVQAYTDIEIDQAIGNYSKILESSEHEIGFQYGSFQGFMKGGIEKFIDDAKPFERYRKEVAQPVSEPGRVPQTQKCKCAVCGTEWKHNGVCPKCGYDGSCSVEEHREWFESRGK